MADKLEIVNMALSLINQNTISSIDEDSKPAALCRLFYDSILKRLLERYDWTFCTESALYLGIVNNVDNGYLFKYIQNYRCIKFCYDVKDSNGSSVRNLVLSGKEPYIIELGVLYSDYDKLILKSIIYQEDCSLYSASFTFALVYSLAAELSKSLIDSASYRQLMAETAERETLNAIFEDQKRTSTRFFKSKIR